MHKGRRAGKLNPERQTVIRKRILSTVGMERESDARYVASYGGGVNSTAMIIHLVNNGLPLDCVVFSDTGNEMPETYEYLKVMKGYLQRLDIPFEIVSTRNKTSLSDRCQKRRVIPSQVWRWCTRDMKVTPIHAFYRALKSHVYQYMGIDYGEVRRMKPSGEDWITNLYPLVDSRIDRRGCIDLIGDAGLAVPVKSGCTMCPFNSMERWAEIHENHPDLYRQAVELEEGGKHFGRQHLAPKGYTLRELGRIMKGGKGLPSVRVDSPCGSECMI